MRIRGRWAVMGVLSAVAMAGLVRGDDDADLAERMVRTAATEPGEVAKTFEVLGGFRMDLIAHEPLVVDPIAMAYAADGSAYVAEMRDYPGPRTREDDRPEHHEAGGRIARLIDTDGDGQFDRREEFVDQVRWPTGIALWQRGVFVSAPPDVWFFEDTTGNGRADVRRRVFTGFGAENVQALVNNLQWGLDHRIYGATAGNGGAIRSVGEEATEEVSVSGRDFAFDPATGAFEAVAGTAQFGNTFDDWGHRFVCSNSAPAMHVALESHYVARNPFVQAPAAVQSIWRGGKQVLRISPSEPYRVIRDRRRRESGTAYAESGLRDDVFTGVSGITVYRGGAYPAAYRGNLFVGETGANLVHRANLARQRASFVATRADADAEFVASTDTWFRPTNFANAPDGTLTVLDMYRETIEHPWSIPEDLKQFVDLDSGNDRGRLYRLTPPGFDVPTLPRLDKATTLELIDALASPHGWWRETAHRLLYERQDAEAVEPLRELLREGAIAEARVHAAWSLAGLEALASEDLLVAIGDESSEVRRHAVRLSETQLDDERVLKGVVALTEDADAAVRMQVALSLGETDDAQATAALAELARRDDVDAWLRTAIVSSSFERAGELLGTLLAGGVDETLVEQLARTVGGRNRPEEVEAVLATLSSLGTMSKLQHAVVIGLGEGLRLAGSGLVEHLGEQSGAVIETWVRDAARVIEDNESSPSEQRRALELLAHVEFDVARDVIGEALDARRPQEVQLAALRALAGFRDAEVPAVLVSAWRGCTPSVQREVVQTLMSRREWVPALFSAVAAGEIPRQQVDTSHQQLLLAHRDAGIRRQAETLWGEAAAGNRADVVEAWRDVVTMAADPARGRVVYTRECAICHQFQGEGTAVGPDLETAQQQSPEQLLLQILDPSKEVAPQYVQYVVLTDDGRSLTGMVSAENAHSITLKRAENQTDTVQRERIEQIASLGTSLMPDGLEKRLTRQELADLLEYLKGSRQ